MKTILSVLIILLTATNVFAAGGSSTSYAFNGNGLPEYPNEGYIFASAYISGATSTEFQEAVAATYTTSGNTVNYTFTSSLSARTGGDSPPGANPATASGETKRDNTMICSVLSRHHINPSAQSSCVHKYSTTTTSYYGKAHCYVTGFLGVSWASSTSYLSILVTTNPTYQISGTVGCVNSTTLKLQTGEVVAVNMSSTAYKFENLLGGVDYQLVFSDGSTYNFSSSTDVVYDYDGCRYTRIYLKDNCGNMMQNTSCDIYTSYGGAPATYTFIGSYWNVNPVELLLGTDVVEDKMLDIYFDTDQGDYHQIDYCEEKSIDVLHPTKFWAINFGAFNATTHDPIPDMKMHVNQSCKPDAERLLNTYAYSGADGYAMFTGLSAQKVYIRMDNDVYKGDRFWVGGLGDAFGTYYTIDTYLDMSGDPDWGNGTDNLSTGCNIYFKDNSSVVTNHIEDTDAYVDLYYQNGNCTATLKFQRLYSTYWMTKESYNIPVNETGYKRLLNSNFSTSGVGYRAIMTASECECNSTMQLYVTNETIEEEQHYENLTAYCSFKHQLGGGQVDYRSDVEISAFAFSNTSATLLNINLTLYEQTSEIATFQCDWADFAGASPKWVYVWAPSVSYDTGKNYTVKMTGYNGHLLDTDDVWTSDIRNNKLTVTVVDNNGLPLSYCYVYLEGWGQAETGNSNVCTIEGLGDGEYQYQATKSGYTSQGWESVNFTGYDQSVTVVLQTAYSADTIRGVKLNDTEIKSIFLPMFFLLWILIVFGGFKYVSK